MTKWNAIGRRILQKVDYQFSTIEDGENFKSIWKQFDREFLEYHKLLCHRCCRSSSMSFWCIYKRHVSVHYRYWKALRKPLRRNQRRGKKANFVYPILPLVNIGKFSKLDTLYQTARYLGKFLNVMQWWRCCNWNKWVLFKYSHVLFNHRWKWLGDCVLVQWLSS